jgi:hypothetical protein
MGSEIINSMLGVPLENIKEFFISFMKIAILGYWPVIVGLLVLSFGLTLFKKLLGIVVRHNYSVNSVDDDRDLYPGAGNYKKNTSGSYNVDDEWSEDDD